MALHWTQEARARIAPRSLDDLKHRSGHYRESWPWLRNSLGNAAWSLLEAPPETATDDEIEAALNHLAPLYSAVFLGKQFGVERVFAMLLGGKGKDKGLSPDVARTLVLYGGAKLPVMLEAATAAWPNGDVALHKTLAYAFFENDEWRQQALHEILKHEGFSNEALALARTEDEVRELLSRNDAKQVIEYCEIPAAIEEAGLSILMELAPKVRGNRPHLSHALALSVFREKVVAEHFAAHLSHPTTRSVITAYFQRFKPFAEEVLPAASKGASRNAALVKALYIKVCGAPVEDIELAPEDDPAIPEVLRSPPWKKALPAPPKMGIDLAKYPRRVTLAPGAGASALKWFEAEFKGAPPMNEEEKAAYLKTIESQTWINDFVVEGKAVPLESILETFNLGKRGRWGLVPDAMIAKFGDAALPGLLREANGWASLSSDVLRAIDAPELAMPHAHQVQQVATPWSRNPWVWLDAQPRAAAYGLLAALDDPQTRTTAEIVLRRLGQRHRNAVLAVAEKVGQLPWVTSLLDRDPHLDFTTPPSVELYSATRPRLKDGRGLPDKALRHLYEMIAFSPLDNPYVGLADVRAACDPKSLSDMAWDLAVASEGTGRNRVRYADWTRWALVHFADDEVIRRLTPALKHAMVYRALEALAVRGNRIAMMEIATAHDRGDSQGRTSMERIADRAGITVPELVETILPTTALSAEGDTTLEYGKRTLKVGFDTTLAPFLFLDDKKLASLPRAKKNDDPIQVRLAKERWDELKEDVRTIARLRCETLEAAIRSRLSIPAPRFQSGWAHHPLGKHLARGMIWGVMREGTLVTFRVAEDSSLADVDDAPITLRDDELVVVPHPLDFDRALLDRWTTVFVDYGLIQPIHQLGRTPIALNPGEESQTSITRPVNIPRSVIDRVLSPIGFVREQRPNSAKAGTIYINTKVDWASRKRMVSEVTLIMRDADGKDVTPMDLDPRDRHEALYAMRLLQEAT